MFSSVVNAGFIIFGCLIGLLIKKGIPEKIVVSVKEAVALCVLYVGIMGAIKVDDTLVAIISLAAGSLIGALFDLDGKIVRLGNKLENSLQKGNKSGISKAFVSSTMLYCTGGMAIIGSLESGISGSYEIILAKSLMDGIISAILLPTLGIGVIFSSISVLIYQGAITIMASFVAPYLTEAVIANMSFVGSILIIGLSLNLLNITKLKLMNSIPAIFIPLILQFII